MTPVIGQGATAETLRALRETIEAFRATCIAEIRARLVPQTKMPYCNGMNEGLELAIESVEDVWKNR